MIGKDRLNNYSNYRKRKKEYHNDKLIPAYDLSVLQYHTNLKQHKKCRRNIKDGYTWPPFINQHVINIENIRIDQI